MTLAVLELKDGWEVGKKSRTHVYLVTGTNDEDTALAAVDETLQPYFPAEDTRRAFSGVYFEAEDPLAVWHAENCIKVTQSWHTPDKKGDEEGSGEESFSDLDIAFEIGMETRKIIKALHGASSQTKGSTNTPDNKGLIGVTKDGVDGIDIQFPIVTFTISKKFEGSEVDDDFLGDIYDVGVAPINNSDWFIFKAGEVRFDGATSSPEWNADTEKNDYRFTFKFSARPNIANISVFGLEVTAGGTTATVSGAMTGWQVLDIRTEQGEATSGSGSGGTLTAREPLITGVWINEVYGSSDFSKLHLGGISL